MKQDEHRADSFRPAILLLLAAFALSGAETYYVDSKSGDDGKDGRSPKTSWRTLAKASGRAYTAGDKLLLRRGSVFEGMLTLNAAGSAEAPVVVGAYAADGDNTGKPLIDAKGYPAGVQIANGNYCTVSDLEIVSDAGTPRTKDADTRRYGVRISAGREGTFGHIILRSLRIHDIFATTSSSNEGRNDTTSEGIGIECSGEGSKSTVLADILIENCVIEKTGFKGISLRKVDAVRVISNTLRNIGGPGIQPSRCNDLVVRGNLVDRSGSFIDERMHGRGSGIWPWSCTDVLIERNAFLHARGREDSCGAHIDFNNSNVIVQYNLSVDNEGGFVEILGNNYNCAYRYNISIDDGARVRDKAKKIGDGYSLRVSGYVGSKKPYGPFNCYVYNNTVYVKPEVRAGFEVDPSARGVLMANNIFWILGTAENLMGPWKLKQFAGEKFQNVFFRNNLASVVLPDGIATGMTGAFSENPCFKNPGGYNPADYVPADGAVKGRGIALEKLPGDEIGLTCGLAVETDFFGNPVSAAAPDVGAIAAGGKTGAFIAGADETR